MVVYNQYELVYSFFIYTVIVPITLGLIQWRVLTKPERWIVVFLMSLLLDELLSVLCIALHTRNHFLYHIQTVAILCSVAGVYTGSLVNNQLLWRIALVISIFMVLEVAFWVGFNHINSVTLAVSRLLAAIYALFGLSKLFSAKITNSLMPNPTVYIHLGFFLFGAFTAVNAYYMSYFIENSLDLFFLFQNISAIVSAVAFGFFSIGFLRIRSSYMIKTQA